tara:strand:+ start:4133 stop:5206 length:1074 start_codon:yes stop_codon:yes gene_type:complete
MKAKSIEFVKAYHELNGDIRALAQRFGMTEGTVNWKIWRVQKEGHVLNGQSVQQTAQTVTPKATDEKVIPTFEKVDDGFNAEAFIPAETSEQYIRRDIDSDIRYWADTEKSALLIGESGSGKTFSVIQYAKEYKLPLLIIPCDDSQVLRELLGFWQAKNGSTEWVDGLLALMLQRPCVVLFDEVNALTAARSMLLHELIQGRTLFVKDAPANKSVIKLHKNAVIFSAMNPSGPQYSGVNKLNCAHGNRYGGKIHFQPFKSANLGVDSGSKEVNDQIKKFYEDVRETITNQRLRVVISKRDTNRISKAIKSGVSISKAVRQGFINSALATAGASEQNALLHIARTIFGASIIDEGRTE